VKIIEKKLQTSCVYVVFSGDKIDPWRQNRYGTLIMIKTMSTQKIQTVSGLKKPKLPTVNESLINALDGGVQGIVFESFSTEAGWPRSHSVSVAR
jgi:hypothetical protein